jgi:hypothetical protein
MTKLSPASLLEPGERPPRMPASSQTKLHASRVSVLAPSCTPAESVFWLQVAHQRSLCFGSKLHTSRVSVLTKLSVRFARILTPSQIGGQDADRRPRPDQRPKSVAKIGLARMVMSRVSSATRSSRGPPVACDHKTTLPSKVKRLCSLNWNCIDASRSNRLLCLAYISIPAPYIYAYPPFAQIGDIIMSLGMQIPPLQTGNHPLKCQDCLLHSLDSQLVPVRCV